MRNKIGRNEKCPCGSGKKYKKCCLKKLSQELYFEKMYKLIGESRNEARIKQCLHPNVEECDEKIIKAHSIQNNRILKKISTNGEVCMPLSKNNLPFVTIDRYGRKVASVFTGFCKKHDKILFQPIEDREFTKTEEQIFLYTYRTFAYEYHRKLEANNFLEIMAQKTVNNHDNQLGFELAIKDFLLEKKEFDNSIQSKYFDTLINRVWEFENEIKFAGSCFYSPEKDFEGKRIQSIENVDVPLSHVFLTVFPQEGKTYAIISWFKKDEILFKSYGCFLDKLNNNERKNFVSNELLRSGENIAINPESWENLSKEKKEIFLQQLDPFLETLIGGSDPRENIGISLFDL
ncbi:SEC-C metal-binding domain-containing protein [Streptococcus anginosus]|uniref:SEC-C metal-binding domain-containing protein n=1 Tax=Streptococcus anginosus TaxID=1328 RepID=UPI0022DF74F6|nr:SEC-C metal-binding domain-containing protein [Streptococcus anginosus]